MTEYRKSYTKVGFGESVDQMVRNTAANMYHYVFPVGGYAFGGAFSSTFLTLIGAALAKAATYPDSVSGLATVGGMGAMIGLGFGLKQAINKFAVRGAGWAYDINGSVSYTRKQANQEIQAYLFSPNVAAHYGVMPQSVEILAACGKAGWFADTAPAVAAWMRGDNAETCRLSGYSQAMLETIQPLTFAAILRATQAAPALLRDVTPQDIVARIDHGLTTDTEGQTIFDQRMTKAGERGNAAKARPTSTFLQMVRMCHGIDPNLFSAIIPDQAGACADQIVMRSDMGKGRSPKELAEIFRLPMQSPIPDKFYSEVTRAYFETAYYTTAAIPSLFNTASVLGRVLIPLERRHQENLFLVRDFAMDNGDSVVAEQTMHVIKRADRIVDDVMRRSELLVMSTPK